MAKYNKNSFLGYINNPMSSEEIQKHYQENAIRLEKCELYCDFSHSLILLIFDTYLGDDVTELEQQVKHFNWCWNRNIQNFLTEGLDFEEEKLYDYFLEFMLEVFYISKDKPNNFFDVRILNLWSNLFDYERSKTKSDLDALLEIYNLFEKALKII